MTAASRRAPLRPGARGGKEDVDPPVRVTAFAACRCAGYLLLTIKADRLLDTRAFSIGADVC